MRMPKFRALAREHRLRGYSRLRKAELIQLIQNDQWNANPPLQSWEPSIMPQRALNRPPPLLPPPPQMSMWEPQTTTQPELEEALLTKRQLKRR